MGWTWTLRRIAPAKTGIREVSRIGVAREFRRLSGRMKAVPTVLRGTLKHPKPEPLLESAVERIHAAVRELKELGIVDEKGNRVRTDIPEDMKEGADRDFGG
jgi:hypothetical protein